MSFDLEDIAEEIAGATGLGREFFANDSFSVFRRSHRKRGKPRTADELRRYKAAWMRRWRAREALVARLMDAAKYRLLDPAKKAKRIAASVESNRKRRSTPTGKQRSRELSLRYYHQRAADPVKKAALREYQRNRYREALKPRAVAE